MAILVIGTIRPLLHRGPPDRGQADGPRVRVSRDPPLYEVPETGNQRAVVLQSIQQRVCFGRRPVSERIVEAVAEHIGEPLAGAEDTGSAGSASAQASGALRPG